MGTGAREPVNVIHSFQSPRTKSKVKRECERANISNTPGHRNRHPKRYSLSLMIVTSF